MKKEAVIFAALLSVYSMTACSGFGGASAEETVEETDNTVEVRTAKPVVRTVSISSNFSGTVEADSTVEVVPKAAGEVIEKYFEVGDHVNEGDLLFKIDDEPARIQLDQARAQVDSANAGLTAQQASNASTKAAANETIAKISSNEAQLNVAVDSAYAQKRSAGNSWENARLGEDFYETEYYEAKDDLHDMKKTKKKLKSHKNEMENTVNAYRDRVASEGKENADKWLKSQGFSSATELEEAYSTAASAYSSADSAVDQYENAIQNYDMQKRVNGNNADSAEMNYYTAEENVALAVQNRDIYNAYTKATTIFGVNAQVVGADASLVNSQAQVRQAKAGLESAEMALENYTVTAPVSGTITDIGISLHNMASSATTAYTIETDSLSKVVFYVAEETVQSVENGNEAIIKRNGEEYRAKITNVGTTLDSDTGLFKIEAVVSEGGSNLLNGSTVSIRTVTRREKNAITVPPDTVYYDDEQAYVLVSDGKNAVRRDVETGISDDDGVAVLSGLTTDDDVIVSWSSNLYDGAEIRVIGSDNTTPAKGSSGKGGEEKTITDPEKITAGSATVEAASDEISD